MAYKKHIRRVVTVALALGITITSTKTSQVLALEDETVEVQLLSFNDFHGELNPDTKNKRGGAAYLAAYIDKLKKENPNTLVMTAGDSIGGTPPVSALKQDEPTLEVFEAMGVDIAGTGNHEYDEGIDELKRLMNGGKHEATGDWNGTNFDWVTANVVHKGGEKKGEPVFSPYKIQNIGGVDIGVIGVVTKDAPSIIIPDGIKDVEFIDEAEAINKYTKELSDKGIKTIVVLAHNEAITDKESGEIVNVDGERDVYDIAQKVDGEVDVIVAAHSHQQANSIIKRDGKDDILVTQANSKGSSITDTDLIIDKTTKDVKSMSAKVITTSHEGITPNKEVEKMVKQYNDDVHDELNRKVGYAQEDIKRDIKGLHGESELGRMIADAQLWATKKDHQTQISMMNIGGVRADLSKGDVTYEDVYTIQPFSNDLTKVDLTGDQIKRILEQQQIHDWVIANQEGKYSRPGMLQIEGFSYEWHPELNENKKWELKVDKLYLNNEDGKIELKDSDKVKAVVNVFLAQGGDGFTVFKESPYEVIKGDLEAFEEYVEEFSKIDADKDGTIGLNKINLDKNPNIVNTDALFTDVPKGHWASDSIKTFALQGYLNGYDDKTFKPNNGIRRDEFVKTFNKVFGLTQKSGKEFTDVPNGHWAKDEIDIAVTNGVCKGTSETTFEPAKLMTREEAAKMLANYMKISDKNHDKMEAFPDYRDVSSWAKDELESVIEKGYITGCSDGTLSPLKVLTRAEAVVILDRAK